MILLRVCRIFAFWDQVVLLLTASKLHQPHLYSLGSDLFDYDDLDVAKNLHKSDFYIRYWVHRYNDKGLEGLKDTRGGYHRSYLTDEPTTTAKWALKGKQPIVSTESSKSRERSVMFGAVNPKDGEVTYSTYNAGNSDTFKDFLKQAIKALC